MVATDCATVTAQDREIKLLSTNELLLTHRPATGVKTGAPLGAAPSLAASTAAEDEAYVSVILGVRENRFAASSLALECVFTACDRRNLVAGERAVRRSERALPLERDGGLRDEGGRKEPRERQP